VSGEIIQSISYMEDGLELKLNNRTVIVTDRDKLNEIYTYIKLGKRKKVKNLCEFVERKIIENNFL